MLYIASAQSPTPILQSIIVPGLTRDGSSSLVVAKPDRIEVWDVEKTGLVWKAELEVWGSIVGIEKVVSKDARPHLVILQGPPNAHLLVVTYSIENSSLVVTNATPLHPPTPSLRAAEFFQGVIVQGTTVLVSLWVGVLSCLELEVEKDKDLKRRRSSVATSVQAVPDKRLRIRENYNINIREQNLLSLAFHPGTSSAVGPVVSFLSLTPRNVLQLQMRAFSAMSHSFTDLVKPMDVVAPGMSNVVYDEDTDYSSIPFSCPGARRAIAIPTDGPEKLALVIGDEFTVLYSFSVASSHARDPASSPSNSPRASAVNRSPQTEVKQLGKRRKSSTSGDGAERWEIKPVWRIRQGFGTVLAATPLVSTASGGVALMGDDSGRLIGAVWESDRNAEGDSAVRVNKIDLGSTSPASSMTYLESGHLFLSSACADSLLLKLNLPTALQPGSPISPTRSPRSSLSRKGKGRESHGSSSISVGETATGSTETVERWMNLAPVKDFCVVGEEGGGASHLVVASGASNANSLRIVRSGAGLEQFMNVEGIEGIHRVWALSTEDQTSLLVSTIDSTMLLHLASGVVEAELSPSIATLPTLSAALLPNSSLLLHVTAAGVTLWSDVAVGTAAASWQSPDEVISASIHNDAVAVATRGGHVHVVKASNGGLALEVSRDVGTEISSLSIHAPSGSASPVLAIGTWANEISICTVAQLQNGSLPSKPIVESYFASSLLLKTSTSEDAPGLQLLAGLSDGTLVTYDLEAKDDSGDLVVRGRKASSLGTQPLSLHPINGATSAGDETLLAIGLSERMSILFESRDRVEFSSVSLKDVVAAASISQPNGENAIVLATPTGLSLSTVNGLKKLHIQTLDLHHRSTNKLAYLPSHKVIASAAVERRIDQETGDFLQKGFIELRDPATLRVLTEVLLDAREEATCIADVLLLGRKYVAIGTAQHANDEDLEDAIDGGTARTKEGRVLLISPDFDQPPAKWTINIECEIKTVGGVRDIATVHGFLAVASASKVSINRYDGSGLTEVSSFASTFVAQSLCTAPPSKHKAEESLIVGDGMRSVLVLDVDEESGKIYGDDRDMATHQVSTLSSISDQGAGVVVADGFSNVLTFRLRERIEPAATFGLHEDVVRFQKGSFAPPTSAPEVINPDLVFATHDGRLGMIGELSDPAAKVLDDLQRNMDKYHKGPGGITWRQFRRGGTPLVQRETAGFIDGDFVQKFLDTDMLGASNVEKILKGSNVHEHITKLSTGQPESATRADVAGVLEATAGLH